MFGFRKSPRKTLTFKESMRAKILGVAKEMDVEVSKPAEFAIQPRESWECISSVRGGGGRLKK